MSRPERYRDATFVIRQTAAYPIVGPREHALHFRNSLLALFSPSDGFDVRYLVALLNSKLLRFVYSETVREAQQRAFPQVKVKALQSLPLRKLDLARASDRRRHDAIVELVQAALDAQRLVLIGGRRRRRARSARRFRGHRSTHRRSASTTFTSSHERSATPSNRASAERASSRAGARRRTARRTMRTMSTRAGEAHTLRHCRQ